MTLSQYLHDCTGITLDSRDVKPGMIFFAYPGTASDGRDYIAQAIAQGASLVVAEAENFSVPAETKVPIITQANLAHSLSEIASEYYQHPSQHTKVIGVTGTNGKTSVTYFLAQVLHHLQQRCGIMGTLGCGEVTDLHNSGLTTPSPIAVQHWLAEFVKRQCPYVVMEASSHALDQRRLEAVNIHCAIFTNLSHDHLDYHQTMAAYGQAKARLFAQENLAQAVLNADDSFSKKLSEKAQNTVFYSTKPRGADITVVDYHCDQQGLHASIKTPWGKADISAAVIGEFQLSNLLAVIACLGMQGFPLNDIVAAITKLQSVPGRMQTLMHADKPLTIIDYAHTPDALANALAALEPLNANRLWVVFGCGGDRDQRKRPLMGAIAARYADEIIITNDNPRNEDPQSIAQHILHGIPTQSAHKIILDRAEAITYALNHAQADDIVLIAGKGHEDYQIIGQNKINFDDYQYARRIFKQMVIS